MKYLKAIIPCVLICANAGAANEVPVRVEVQTDRVAHEVSPTLHGIFFEDINYDRVAGYSRSGAVACDDADADPLDVNSFDTPFKVVPREETFTTAQGNITRTLAPNSFTVLRVPGPASATASATP